MADYQKMYYKLMDAVENALEILETTDAEAEFRCKKAASLLICGEQVCQELYIRTSK